MRIETHKNSKGTPYTDIEFDLSINTQTSVVDDPNRIQKTALEALRERSYTLFTLSQFLAEQMREDPTNSDLIEFIALTSELGAAIQTTLEMTLLSIYRSEQKMPLDLSAYSGSKEKAKSNEKQSENSE